jgi:hypothetical protein
MLGACETKEVFGRMNLMRRDAINAWPGYRRGAGIAILLMLMRLETVLLAQAPLPNDSIAEASRVVGDAFQLAADLGQATSEPFELTESGAPMRTLWWRWTAPATGLWRWTRTGTNAVEVDIFVQDPFGQLTAVGEPFRRPRLPGYNFSVTAPDRGTSQAASGRDHWIRLSVPSGAWRPAGAYLVEVAFAAETAPRPPNDDYAARTRLGGTNADFGGSLAGATRETGEPGLPGSPFGHTRWWSWTAPGRGTVVIAAVDTNSVTLAGAFHRGPFNHLERVGSSATEFGNRCYQFEGARREFRFDVETGETYDIVLDLYQSMDPDTVAAYTLAFLPAPANDEFWTPMPVAGMEVSIPVSNISATRNFGESTIPGAAGSNSVWFEWTAPTNGVVQISSWEPVRYAEPGFEVLYFGGSGGGGVIAHFESVCEDYVDLHPLPRFVPVWGIYEGYRSGANIQFQFLSSQIDTNAIPLVATVRSGAVHRIGLDGVGDSAGETSLRLLLTPPPSNDDFTNRIHLPTAPVRVSGRTFAATVGAEDSSWSAGPYTPTRSVWWQWTVPTSGLWGFASRSTDTAVSMRKVSEPAGGTNVLRSSWSPTLFEGVAGDTYLIHAATYSQQGYGGSISWGGNLTFSLVPINAPQVRIESVGLADVYGPVLLRLNVASSDGRFYALDWSTNMVNWTPIRTNLTYQQETFWQQFELEAPLRFYRSRLVR